MSNHGRYKMLDSKYPNWTQCQIDIVLNEYGTKPILELAKKVNKCIGSIYNILAKENINVNKNYWTEEELEFLKKNYSFLSNTDMRQALKRSEDSIQMKAASFGLKKDQWWSDWDREKLIELFEAGYTHKEIGLELDRTQSSVHNQLQFLNLSDDIKRWTKEELSIIESMANSIYEFTYADIALKVNAKPEQIMAICNRKKWTQGIKRSISNGAAMILGFLRDAYGHKQVISEFHIGELLKLDAYIPMKNIGIEYDGIQHFVYPNHFHKSKHEFNNQLKRDCRKNEICKELGINLIRIPYTEKFTNNILISKIDIQGDGRGSQLLTIYNKHGGYISIQNEKYKQKAKEKERTYRKEQYQKMKQFKKQLKDKKNV